MARVAGDHEDRERRDEVKLKRLVEYVESRARRWHNLLDDLGGDVSIAVTCGHCDLCVPAAVP